MNIVLIGMRGCGKSSVSRRLALCTKRNLFSSDALISYENQGEEISDIIEKSQGDWRVFRELEYLVIKKIVTQSDLIIDTGGGVVVDLDDEGGEIYSERKISLLKNNGLIFWLKGGIETLIRKTRGDVRRPPLSQNKSDEELMENRLPFYEAAADVIVDVEGKKRKEVAVEILQHIGKHPDFSNLDMFKL
ncbi:MAG: shikimate kinase [Magnetococcales bacterium]|nr:shikimate kinase [Magnetococcales bacterium]